MPLSIENDLAHKLIGYSIEIHKTVGPGLDPKIYKSCLISELKANDHDFTEELSLDLVYRDQVFKDAIVCDLLVEDKLAVYIDKSETLSEIRVQNLLKVLREHQLKLGLIINFNAQLMKNGIRRVTNHKLVGENMEAGEYYEGTSQ